MTQSPFLKLAQARRTAGLCVTCGKPQPPGRYRKWRCPACTVKYRVKPKKHHEHDGPQQRNPHAGDVDCLKCTARFTSPDKRLVRLCPKCHIEAGRLMTVLGCEEAIYA